MPNFYITKEQLQAFGIATESDSDDNFDLLAESVSRLFDRECEVSNGFFEAFPDGGVSSEKIFRGNGTRFIKIHPYVPDAIFAIVIDNVDYFRDGLSAREYQEKDSYLIFDFEIAKDTIVTITANWGFADSVPVDVQLACIEQALFQWRRKDLSFADISGVPTAAVVAEFSPSFLATAKRYREIYSENGFFS